MKLCNYYSISLRTLNKQRDALFLRASLVDRRADVRRRVLSLHTVGTKEIFIGKVYIYDGRPAKSSDKAKDLPLLGCF